MNPLPSTMAILSPVTLALATSKNEINDSDDGGDQHPHCLRYQKKQEHYRSLMDNDVDDDDSRGTIDDDDDGDDDDDDVDGDDDNKNGGKVVGYNGQKNILTIHNGNNGKCGKTNLLLLSTPKPYIKRSKSVETLSFLMQKEKLIFPIVTNNLNGDDDDDDDLVERTELESKTKTRKSDSKSDLILTDVKSIIKSIAIPERFQSSTVAVSVSIPKTNDFIQCNEPLNEDKSILNFSEGLLFLFFFFLILILIRFNLYLDFCLFFFLNSLDDNNYDDDDDGESGDKSDDSGVEIINDIHQKTILIASKTTKEETTIKLDCKQKTDIGVLNQTESKCLQSELISSILSHQNNETITSQHQSSSQSNRNLINNSKEIEMIATMRDVSKNSTDTKSSISLETTLNTSSVNIKTKSSIDSNHSRSSTSSSVALSLQNQKHHHHHHHHNPIEPNPSELPKPDTVKTVKRLFEHCDQSVNQNLSLSSRKIQSSKTQQSVSSSSLTNHRQKNYPAPAPPLPPRQTQSSPTTSTTVSIVGQTKSITTTSIGRVLKKPTISSKPNSVIQQQQQQQHQRQQQQQQHQERSNSLATITTNNHHSRSGRTG
ncbi:hypothetical protein QR98_0089410 [Sarcoptes scabiei]|uniref:Uncharacterized protein n=1 Tax=Sarcoptes scabiei TaxID=52283 RepID=A0A132AHA6_SARSC|nr:hypothetical protein QR98_0089410 [Sarcoptes scabiei]